MAIGIDVSHWDGVMNWATSVAAGAQFAYIKAGEGTMAKDTQFDANWAHTKGRLPRGAYWFWRYGADPVKQAQSFASICAPDRGELPPVLDLEDNAAPQMAADLPGRMRSCLAEIERLWQKPCMIYTGAWWWNAWVAKPGCMADRDVWVADYRAVTVPRIPTGWTAYKIWQFSADGNRRGAEFGSQSGDMDVNRAGDDFLRSVGIVPPVLTDGQKLVRLWDAHPELH